MCGTQGDKTQINLYDFQPFSRVNGPGTRAVVWVRGCSIRCEGCWNKDTWASEPCTMVSVEEVFSWIMAVKGQISGVTFLGGEPFLQAEALAALGAMCQEAGLPVLTYTGFTLEFLQSEHAPRGAAELLCVTDTLIDGPFVANLRNVALVWRGSSNQRIIHLTDRMVGDFADAESDRFAEAAFEVVVTANGTVSVTEDQPQHLVADLAEFLAGVGIILDKIDEVKK